jgi:hypothetical protein
MWSGWTCVAAICLGLAPQVEAAERSGLVHRASCTAVRLYVAKYTASAAETRARSHRANEVETGVAPSQTAQADH